MSVPAGAHAAGLLPPQINTLADLAQLEALGERLTTDAALASSWLAAPAGASATGAALNAPVSRARPLVWRRWRPFPAAAVTEPEKVLLLHGGSGSWAHWARTIGPLLQSGRDVLVPDMPGFGDSASPAQGHDADALPAPLEAGLRALVGDVPLEVVGFSLGALVAAFLATRYPRRVVRLVLVGAPALSNERIEMRALKPWQAVPAGPQRDVVHLHNLQVLMLAREATADALALAIHARGVEADRLVRRRLMLSTALREMLPGLACSLGGIWGTQDALYRHRLPLLQGCLPLAPKFLGLHLIADAGHWVMHEAPAEFAQALLTLLQAPGPAVTRDAARGGEVAA